ncbi:4Fe-4S dicluster domain-containing protein, partial [Bacteroidales bacterium OttesenSCG-928-A14]|nr:4Fe-4S dicluster domain-containing protein [Bacteroidales bacterium OttesenSCG-928-A14]
MLRKIRITAAIFCFTLISLLFLDFTGTLHGWFGWLAKIQFIPALLAVNIAIVAALLLLTWIFGRVYCSVICPLGIFQDIISWASKKRKKYRFSYSPAIKWLRYTFLAIFCIALVAGISFVVSLLDPYSAYGRIVSNLFAPIYQGANNLLAYFSEKINSYAFYSIDVWLKGLSTFIVAIISLIALFILAWRNGRTYCNTICPVGTVLGFVSRFSIFKPRFDTQNCTNCGLCERSCKASCINSREQTIDYSRCVSCMDCVDICRKKSLRYLPNFKLKENVKPINEEVKENITDNSRRQFLTLTATLAAASALKAQTNKVDGGLAFIEDKKIPNRATDLTPPGSSGMRNFNQHCTACQLCVSVCPNQVLRPSNNIERFMQPKMSYERGYCRPECTKCSEVCPTGAIKSIDAAEKSSIQIGQAVFIKENCVVNTDGVSCGNCARHCPTGAIHMIPKDESADALATPVIETQRCIGCGACEYLCPARP